MVPRKWLSATCMTGRVWTRRLKTWMRFSISRPRFLPSEAEVGQVMVEAAKQAGVRRFVFSSVIHPVISALVNHRDKATRSKKRLSSPGWNTLCCIPAMFFQNYAEGWDKVLKTGVYTEPWSAQTRFSRVDYRDVAEVAAIALTEDRLNYGTYELCAEGQRQPARRSSDDGRSIGKKHRGGRH